MPIPVVEHLVANGLFAASPHADLGEVGEDDSRSDVGDKGDFNVRNTYNIAHVCVCARARVVHEHGYMSMDI